MEEASFWIKRLSLQKHPEGGYFRETYRSEAKIQACCIGDRFIGPRSVSTAIYFLLPGDEISALHRIRSDEIWHYYTGASLTIHIIDVKGTYQTVVLGCRPEHGETPQAVVTAGDWFGATVNDAAAFTLAGCTVAPGFDFKDFEMGDREDLIRQYPAHRSIIDRLTR